MATKRSVGSESGVSGAAPARAKSTVTRKHTNSAAAAKTKNNRPAAISTTSTGFAAPTFDQIAQLAYSYWEARGRQDGSHLEDWFRAERDLRQRT